MGSSAAGIAGGPNELSAQEVSGGQATYTEAINSEEGVQFDVLSRLVSAVHMERTITIRGEPLMYMADLSDGYFDSRLPQIANKLCTDAATRTIPAGGTFNINWFSKDGDSLGDMITVPGG